MTPQKGRPMTDELSPADVEALVRRYYTTVDAGDDNAQQPVPRGIRFGPNLDGHWPEAHEVSLVRQLRFVADVAEVAAPGHGIRQRSATQPLEGGIVQGRLGRLDEARDARIETAQMQRRRVCRTVGRTPRAQRTDAQRVPGGGAETHCRVIPPRRTTTLRTRTGRSPVDEQTARLDPLEPRVEVIRVARVQAGDAPRACSVLTFTRLGERGRRHDRDHRRMLGEGTKPLKRGCARRESDTRAPQPTVGGDTAGLDQPAVSVGKGDIAEGDEPWADLGARISRGSDAQ